MYGLPFPPAAERIGQLAEAIEVCKLLWTERRATFRGRWFALTDALCEPKPVQQPHPPIWVGGGGERRTLRVVARHADGWNYFLGPIAQVEQKLAVLRGHCREVGRDVDEIRKSLVGAFIVRDDPAQVEEEVARFARERQLPAERARAMVVAGTPEEVAERLVPYAELGIDLFLLQDRAPFDYETLRLLAERVAPRVRERVPVAGGR
jgi:alkanesulfonate monooxygenase SsuD/methylene tetrahydromethanopterin reductase-like flavin-dependent oxidoreductase (luciferase family)